MRALIISPTCVFYLHESFHWSHRVCLAGWFEKDWLKYTIILIFGFITCNFHQFYLLDADIQKSNVPNRSSLSSENITLLFFFFKKKKFCFIFLRFIVPLFHFINRPPGGALNLKSKIPVWIFSAHMHWEGKSVRLFSQALRGGKHCLHLCPLFPQIVSWFENCAAMFWR